jgi:hypothetical protein
VIARLRATGHRVVEVRTGDAFARIADDLYVLSPPNTGREGLRSAGARPDGAWAWRRNGSRTSGM